jgi:hypothetical protein
VHAVTGTDAVSARDEKGTTPVFSKRIRALVITAVAICVTGINLAPSASAATEAAAKSFIRNSHTGQCVAIPGGSHQSNTQAIQFGCAPLNDSRLWYVTKLFVDAYWNNVYQIRNAESGSCLVYGVDEKAVQVPCSDIPDFTGWAFDKASRLHYVNRTQATGKCLAVPGGSQTEGTRLILWPCGSGFEQQWYIGNA